MSQRLQQRLRHLEAEERQALSLYLMAGYPTIEATVQIIPLLEQAGVDFVELGIPFSDPIADGPVIQMAANQALQNGVTVQRVLEMVATIRQRHSIPILLMGYTNPVYQFGMERFVRTCQDLQVDGIILPDLPLEESLHYLPFFQKHQLDFIHLIAPNTPDSRIQLIDRHTTAFIYCTAYTGVTGKDHRLTPEGEQFFRRLNRLVTHPVMIGFGVKTHQDFQYYGQFARGVIIGTAFLKFLANLDPAAYATAIPAFVRSIRKGENSPEGK
ncbi:MAG: tryptophan synthase subunit alpha [Calditrichaeota bacterium]|nr:tryptophan synthase subunit alpha [Calditrichota bacterium]